MIYLLRSLNKALQLGLVDMQHLFTCNWFYNYQFIINERSSMKLVFYEEWMKRKFISHTQKRISRSDEFRHLYIMNNMLLVYLTGNSSFCFAPECACLSEKMTWDTLSNVIYFCKVMRRKIYGIPLTFLKLYAFKWKVIFLFFIFVTKTRFIV